MQVSRAKGWIVGSLQGSPADGARTPAPLILVVEDEPEIGDLILEMLKDDGYRVIWRSQGDTGLATATAYNPDLIVLDVRLPLLDGGAILRALKADPKTSPIPIIIVSGATFRLTPADQRLVHAVLDKPFDREDLIDAVHRAIGPPRPPFATIPVAGARLAGEIESGPAGTINHL